MILFSRYCAGIVNYSVGFAGQQFTGEQNRPQSSCWIAAAFPGGEIWQTL